MNKFRVVLTHPNIPQAGINVLLEKCDVIAPQTPEEVIKEAKTADALFTFARSLVVNQETLTKIGGSRLKIVANMGVGMDHIDVKALDKIGVKASNTAGSLDNSVAEVAVALALAAGHKFTQGLIALKNGTWIEAPQWNLGQDIYGSTIGIVGLGNIGRAIAKRLFVFEPAKIVYSGNTQKPYAKEFNGEYVSLTKLLTDSDFVILVCPLTEQTKHLINKDTLKLMKKTAILVNVARGDIVEQNALVEALKCGQIGGAGLDVMTPEPLPTDHPLVSLDNVVLTPHVGSATVATRNRMSVMAANNILAALNGDPIINLVLP